jgi:4-aminobutyrate aminotransferase/(S)-3-amino-2-methylpropionate transaminase
MRAILLNFESSFSTFSMTAPITLTRADELIERRKKVVSNGVGIFAPTTALHAKGSKIYDADGNEWIDFGTGIGVTTLGHCPEPVAQAIAKQAQELIHACFHVSSYEPYIALCEKLVELFPHGDATKVMLTNTGAEAVENAIKIARQATKRQAIVCFSEGFHGRSMMAMTLTSKVSYKLNCGPFAPEVYRQPFPNWYHDNDGLSEEAFVAREVERLHYLFKSVVPANQIAAFIIEPVQGEGGFNVTPKGYLQSLREICTKEGILLIADEVQAGFCRTGKWASYEHFGITPDLSTWAKAMGSGMPIGCVIGKAEIMDKAVPGTIGGTYPGNPVCCAAALAAIKHMEELNLNERATHIGTIMRQRMETMQAKLPQTIGDIRGLGAMLAMELVIDGDKNKPASQLTDDLLKKCWERRLLILPAGLNRNIIRFLLPLIIEEDTLHQGFDILQEELYALTGIA